MSNCSKCGMPLEPSEAQCLYCGEVIHGGTAAPEAQPDEDAGNAVAIATFVSMEEAEACKAKLEAAGVAAMLDSGAAEGPWGQVSSGPQQVQLWVRDTDAEHAQAILTEGAEAPAAAAPADLDDLDENAFADAPLGPSALPPERPQPAQNHQAPVDVRALESKLSSLMDDKDVPGWTVNPAFHPDVIAFIAANSANAAFVKKAKALQENRASYYAKMRSQVAEAETEAEPAAVEEVAEFTEGMDEDNVPDLEDVVGTRRGPVTAVATRPAAKARPRKRRRRWLTVVLVLIFVPVAVMLTSRSYFQKAGQKKLDGAVAAADAKGGWRLKDLKAPDAAAGEGNGVATTVRLANTFDQAGIKPALPLGDVMKLEPNVPLSPEQVKLLEPISEKVTAPVVNGIKQKSIIVRAFPLQGPLSRSYPARDKVDELLTKPPSFPRHQIVSDVMLLDAALRAQQGKSAAALTLAREALGVGRSLGDDVAMPAQTFRVACRHGAVAAVERTLAFGEAPPDDLLKTQRAFLDEADAPLLNYVAKGQRAVNDEIMNRLEANAGEMVPDGTRKKAFHIGGPGSAIAPAEHWLKFGWILENHGRGLELFNNLVELSTLPDPEQLQRYREFERSVRDMEGSARSSLARLEFPEVVGFARDYYGSRTELRVAAAALAIERFRLANNRWPEKIEDLDVPDPLPLADSSPYVSKAQALDPCDGQPLRIRKFDAGIMVYSVGLDGKDNEGHFDRANPNGPDTDVVFRLWDANRRGK